MCLTTFYLNISEINKAGRDSCILLSREIYLRLLSLKKSNWNFYFNLDKFH